MDIIIAGAAGAGLKAVEILDTLQAAGKSEWRLVGFIDDNEAIWGTQFFDVPVLGGVDVMRDLTRNGPIAVVCSIGDPVNRRKMVQRISEFDVVFPNLVHTSAQISGRASIGQGNMFCQNVVVQPGVTVGDFNSFNIAAILGPLAAIQDYCTINSSVMVASGTVVNDYTYIGMGAKILQRIELGEGTLVGANAFVHKSTEPWTTVVGVPARPIKTRERPRWETNGSN